MQVQPVEGAPLRVGRLLIEFDETSQMQRLRSGVQPIHAVFSVLEPQLQSAELKLRKKPCVCIFTSQFMIFYVK